MKKLLRTLVFVSVLAPASLLAAQDDARDGDAPRSAADERATAFEAVTGARHEDVPGGPLLIGAYGLVWALTMGYLFRLGKLASGLEADIERLTKDVADAKAKQA